MCNQYVFLKRWFLTSPLLLKSVNPAKNTVILPQSEHSNAE
jgi:hypothetical protein